jgi:hypothetical protein
LYDTIFAEQHHKPAVALVNRGFVHDARSAAASKGVPGARFVPTNIPCECTESVKISAAVQEVLSEVVAALTRPLSPAEIAPEPRPTELTHGVVFEGDLQEVQRFFYKRGWTDGLPILPPTRDAVEEMLSGTDLPADHIVGKMIPRLGKATVEKIAINAVMAGALPTAMPLLIAAVEAMLDPLSNYGIFQVSTGSWSPFLIVNGPIREQVHLNGSSGALSPGDLANATIGRAIGLIAKNLGGARKGLEDMGVLGNPAKYSMVLAENEEASPWEPLHVQHGFSASDNCVTVSFPNSYVQIVPRGTDDAGIVGTVLDRLGKSWRQVTVLMCPSHAASLAEAGWTPERFIAELERARPAIPGTGIGRLADTECGARVVVAGGPGAWIGLVLGVGRWVSRPVSLPAGWERLVRKYREYAPNYLRY